MKSGAIPNSITTETALKVDNVKSERLTHIILFLAILMAAIKPAVYGYFYVPESFIRLFDLFVYFPAVILGTIRLLTSHQPKFGRSPIILCFALLSILSLGWTISENIFLTLYRLFIMLSIIPISALIETKETERLVVNTACLGFLFLVLSNWYYAFIYQFFEKPDFRLGTQTGPQYFSNANELAFALGLGLIFFINIWSQQSITNPRRPSFSRIIILALSILFFISLLATGSRSALIALMLVVIFMFFRTYPKARVAAIMIILLGLILFLGLGSQVSTIPGVQRFADLIFEGNDQDISVGLRRAFYELSIKAINDDPTILLLGRGTGSSDYVMMQTLRNDSEYLYLLFRGRYNSLSSYYQDLTLFTHSMFLDLILSFGSIGILLIVAISFNAYQRTRALAFSHDVLLLQAMLLYLFIQGFFGVPYFQSSWIILGSLIFYHFSILALRKSS